MSYQTIETAVLAVLRTHADFDSNNCVAGTPEPIKKGYARVIRVLRGGHFQEPITIQAYLHRWTVNIDLYVPWKGRMSTLETDLITESQKVVDTLHEYPRLNGATGVIGAEITNANQPEPLVDRKGRYRGQRLFLEVKETVTPTRQE